MMLVGMGAGLLLARPACAQQEMDPELFDVYANTTVTDQASHATPGAEGSVLPHHGIAAAVREDQIVLRHERTKRIIRILRHAVERGRRVDIPEDDGLSRTAEGDHLERKCPGQAARQLKKSSPT